MWRPLLLFGQLFSLENFMKLLTVPLLTMCVLSAIPLLTADQTAENADATWKPLALKAQTLERDGKFAAAAESAKRALQVVKTLGPSDPRLATTHHLLGIIYRDWGHCNEARSNYSQAIRIWLLQPQPNPRFVFNSIASLVSVFCECDDFPGAAKAFHTYQAELRSNATGLLGEAKLNSLQGALARGKKEYVQAEAFYRRTIELMERALEKHEPGSTPNDLAVEWSSLGVVLDKEGRYDESLAQSMRSITYFEEHMANHPNLIAALNNAACSLAGLGRKDDSERMFQRAIAASTELYGEDNHVTAKIMLSYAQVLRQNKESPAAEEWHKKGVEAFRRALARDSGTVDVADLRAPRK
jgi:tetratricopeptide (TPR) repeat protein